LTVNLELTNSPLVSLLDDEDYYRLCFRSWRLIKHHGGGFYVACDVRYSDDYSEKLLLHREVLRIYDSRCVDHINRNGLDNRRENLRTASQQQNKANSIGWRKETSSQYKGVYFESSRGLWRAKIMYDGKSIHLGRYKTEIEAACAYDKKALELFGEFARLNFT
jgi:hypothetical protein